MLYKPREGVVRTTIYLCVNVSDVAGLSVHMRVSRADWYDTQGTISFS